MARKKNTRKALGRGLSALISTPEVNDKNDSSKKIKKEAKVIAKIPRHQKDEKIEIFQSERGVTLKIDQLKAHMDQPRKEFRDVELAELAESIKTHGIIQPILVRKSGDAYQIVAGERRYRAAKLANLSEVPVIIKDLTDQSTLELALIENIQRKDLSPLEEAQAYKSLMQEFSLTQQELAKRVGKSRSGIANFVRILDLEPSVLKMLTENKLTVGHAKSLLTIKEPAAQINLAKKIVAENLSVRALEEIVDRVVQVDGRNKNKHKVAAAVGYSDLENKLKNKLGTKVRVKSNSKGAGSITISYYSDQELSRLVDILQ